MDFLVTFCTSPSEKIKAHEVDGYRWIDYGKILSDMPLLKGRTRKTVKEKLEKLEKFGLIKTQVGTHRGKPRKYVRLTALGKLLIRGKNNEYLDVGSYKLFIGWNCNEDAARRIAFDEKFLSRKQKKVSRILNDGAIENKAAALVNTYSEWLENEKDLSDEELEALKEFKKTL